LWVVTPRIDQNGITGLGTLLSGSYIAFSAGSPQSEVEHEFKVSDLPPLSAAGQTGLRLTLTGKNRKMIGAGSPVMYENHTVGTVESAKFDPKTQSVQYSIFIQSPNESLVNSGSHFWLDSGIDVRLDGGGIKVDSAPLAAILSGAIAFDSPPSANNVSSGTTFTIHNDRAEIENQPNERTIAEALKLSPYAARDYDQARRVYSAAQVYAIVHHLRMIDAASKGVDANLPTSELYKDLVATILSA